MKSIMRSPMRESMRGPTQEEAYAFSLKSIPGGLLYDDVSKVGAVTSIAGTRYGLVNGVVTQFAVNQVPLEDDGLRGCPAFTQLAKYSEDLTNAVWTKAYINTPVLYGTFQGEQIWDISENTTVNQFHTLSQSVGLSAMADNSVVGLSLVCKDKGRKISLILQTKANTYISARFNLATGIVENNTGIAASIQSLSDGFFRLTFAASLLSGATTPILYAQLVKMDNTQQYTGDGVSGVYAGHPTYINFGVSGIPFIPPYVPNNTSGSISVVSEAATATTGTSFDLDDVKLTKARNSFRSQSINTELFNSANVVSGYINPGSTAETLTADATTRTTEWMSVGAYNNFDIVPSGGADRMNIQCKKADGTIIFVAGTSAVPFKLYVPAGFIWFRVYYNSDTTTYPSAALSVKPFIPAQGHLDMEFRGSVENSWFPTAHDINLLSANNNIRLLFMSRLADGRVFLKSLDTAPKEASIQTQAFTVGQIYKISLDWGTHSTGQKMRITVNGVKSTIANFSGAFGAQDLRFFYGNTVHAGWIVKDSLKIGDKPLW